MRTLEIILIFVNLLFLLWGSRQQSKRNLFVAAGANIIVLLIHGIVEGLRYQMAFSYLFVLLWLLYALAKTYVPFPKTRVFKILKITTAGLCCILLIFTSFLAYALPVFTLPALTGDYAVGIKYFDLVDETRIDPFLSGSTQKRELMIKVYYPAQPDHSKPFSAYFGGSSQLIHAFAEFYNLPSFAFDHLLLVKTHARDDLKLSDKEPNYPVILFSHGAGATMEVETSQSQDLASHGYIVVAVDHPYVSSVTVFPNHMVTAREATTNFDTPEPADPITQIMADDIKFVIQKLADLNNGSITPNFKGKLNLDEIGIIGHSVGGAVAYNLAINENKVKAAINLDGAVYVIPKNTTNIAPFLMLANDQFHVEAIQKREGLIQKFDSTPAGQQEMLTIYGSQKVYDDASAKAQQNISTLANVLKISDNLYTIQGSAHMKFTDIGLFFGSQELRKLINIGGETDPAECLEITEAVTVAFFDQHLKGKSDESLKSLMIKYSELRKVDLK